MKRREAREKVLQILFEHDITKKSVEEVLDFMQDEYDIQENDMQFIQRRVLGTKEHAKEIDNRISNYLKGWTLNRLSYVDRAILRSATYEILYIDDVSISVTINEAIELAKIFGTSDSAKFINGVLGSLVKEVEKELSQTKE